MKFYKKENNEFIGFYDSNVNKEIFKDEGSVKEGFYELSEEKWKALLGGQSEGKEIKILKDGTLGLYEKPTYTGGEFVKPIFDEVTETWKEGATVEDMDEEIENLIVKINRIDERVKDLESSSYISRRTKKLIAERKQQKEEVIAEIERLEEIIEKLENQQK